MNLTAGATLQNQKYVIQKLLHQSDLGVTYRARHAYLEQSVLLQTFNQSLQQRSDFAQLRQQFLNQVRSMVQQPARHAVRVLDCFEEGDFPFVVLECAEGQPLPAMVDWLSLSQTHAVDTAGESTGGPKSMPSRLPEHAQSTVDQVTGHVSAGPITAQPLRTALNTVASEVAETLPPAPGAPPFQPSSAHASPESPSTPYPLPSHPSSRTRPPIWMPITLLFVSMLCGLLGAGLGLSLRLAPTAQSSVDDSDDSTNPIDDTPNLQPGLFSREQSFPSKTDWPISEIPPLFPSDPTPIETPVYRVPVVDGYAEPEAQPLPPIETSVQEPVLPPLEPAAPTVKTATPQPSLPPEPVAPNSPSNLPNTLITTPPEVGASEPAFEAPPEPVSEPVPPPLAPVEPASPAPAFEPLPPLAPAVPNLPTNDPKVIDQ